MYNLHIKYVYILKNITKRAVKSIDKVCLFELKFSQVIFITLSLIQDLCRLGNLKRERERGLSRIVRKKNFSNFSSMILPCFLSNLKNPWWGLPWVKSSYANKNGEVGPKLIILFNNINFRENVERFYILFYFYCTFIFWQKYPVCL